MSLIYKFVPPSPEPTHVEPSLFIRFIDKAMEMHILIKFIVRYLLAMMLGGIMGGVFFIPWINYKLNKLWPNIEVQIGPEHKFVEKHRRAIFVTVISTCVIPFAISLIHDIAKVLVTIKP